MENKRVQAEDKNISNKKANSCILSLYKLTVTDLLQ